MNAVDGSVWLILGCLGWPGQWETPAYEVANSEADGRTNKGEYL